jgi:hypothetical protein
MKERSIRYSQEEFFGLCFWWVARLEWRLFHSIGDLVLVLFACVALGLQIALQRMYEGTKIGHQ